MIQEKYTGEDQEELFFDKTVEDFNNQELPYKVRKIKLLKAVDLPIPKTECFKREEINSLREQILEESKTDENSFVVRFACTPDKFSMPFFYVEKTSKKEIERKIEEINSFVESDQSIQYIILQEVVSAEGAKDKISGRVLFEEGRMAPTQEVLEIYKGSRSTGVLNNVDVNDPNFLRFTKKAGEFMKPEKKLSEDSSVTEGEIREIYNYLNLYREKIETLIKIIAKSQNKSINNMPISLEFSYKDSKFFFSDIDF